MATIIRRGQDYIISVNMGYDYDSKKIQPVQKVIVPPSNLANLKRSAWLDTQADNFESEVKQRQAQAITVSEFAQLWLADTTKASHNRNSTDLKWILPQLGVNDLKRLTPSILADFHSRVKAETALTFTTREHIHRTLCTMLSDAVAQGYIKLNPAFRTFPYEQKKDKKAAVSLKQLRKFAQCLDGELPKHALFYNLLLATGIKRAECVGLKWSDIDFNCGEIAVNRIVIVVTHEPVLVKDIPTRTVYLSTNMCAILQGTQKHIYNCRKGWDCKMASIRKRGNSYLIVVSMGYDYEGNQLRLSRKRSSHQRTTHQSRPKDGLMSRQFYLNEPLKMSHSQLTKALPLHSMQKFGYEISLRKSWQNLHWCVTNVKSNVSCHTLDTTS